MEHSATEQKSATRAALLEAAKKLFAAKGFGAATVRDICTEAGANIATALPWHVQGNMVRGVASDVKVAGEFADKLLQHIQAGGFIKEDLDWFWNANGTIGLRFNEPPPDVHC